MLEASSIFVADFKDNEASDAVSISFFILTKI